MLKTIIAAALLTSATAFTAQAARLASPATAREASPQQGLMLQVRNERRGKQYNRHRDRHWDRSGRHYRDRDGWRRSYGRHYRHRYGYRPRDWWRRGCWNIGPAWFCP